MGIGVEVFTFGVNAIDEQSANFQNALQGVDPSSPQALIKLQLQAFLFTNTVSSVTGTLQSVSSATQSAAQKVGQ